MVQLVTGKVVKLFEFDRCELIARDRSRCRATPLLGAAGRELPEPTRARGIMPRLSAQSFDVRGPTDHNSLSAN